MSKYRMVFVLKFSFIKKKNQVIRKPDIIHIHILKVLLIGAPFIFDKVRAHTRIRRAIPWL